jgi:hypothetical protein
LNEQHTEMSSVSTETLSYQVAPAIGYKLVAKVGSHYFSLWAGSQLEYVLGQTIAEVAQPKHHGGIYICATPQDASRVKVPSTGEFAKFPRVVLKCECEGPFVQYEGNKFACSQLTPLEEVSIDTKMRKSASLGAQSARADASLGARSARAEQNHDPVARRP